MSFKITHTEFSQTTPESVWGLWSDVATWSHWDRGLEWCKLNEGHRFEVDGEGFLLPKGVPEAVGFRIIECSVNKSFTDESNSEFGHFKISHEVLLHENGVKITHTMVFKPANLQAHSIFEMHMLPKLQKELPESVKVLAEMAESLTHSCGCR